MATRAGAFLLLALAASGGENEDEVLAAFRAGDTARLKKLAERGQPDPWVIAERLLRAGEREAALAFAGAAPRREVSRLAGYLRAWRADDEEEGARNALDRFKEAFTRKKFERALATVAHVAAEREDMVSVRVHNARALALTGLGRRADASRSFARAAEIAGAIGWIRQSMIAWSGAAACAHEGGDPAAARAACDRQLAASRLIGDVEGEAAAVHNLGVFAGNGGRFAEAHAHLQKALALARRHGLRAREGQTLTAIADVLMREGRAADAVATARAAMRLQGDPKDAARALGGLARAHEARGEYAEAEATWARALEIYRETGDEAGIAMCTAAQGDLLFRRGELLEARARYEEALPVLRRTGQAHPASGAAMHLGLVHLTLGENREALAMLERAYAELRRIGDLSTAAAALGNIAMALRNLGHTDRALASAERALAEHEAIGDRVGVARMLGNLAALHSDLGNDARAVELMRRAFAMQEKADDRPAMAQTLASLGVVYARLGRIEEGRAHMKRALGLLRDLGRRREMAALLANFGAIHVALGRVDEAVDLLREALALQDGIGDLNGVAVTLRQLGRARRVQQRNEEARACFRRALEIAERIEATDQIVLNLVRLAIEDFESQEFESCLARAQRARTQLPRLVRGLGEEEGAAARDTWARVYAMGALAAVELHDAAAMWTFLEEGRAGALLESLGARDQLRDATVPQGLREAERAAQIRVATAHAAKDRKALHAAKERLLEVVERIRREQKGAAQILYPSAAPLDTVQRLLAPTDAMVLYGMFETQAVALVVTADEARTIYLGQIGPIEAASAGTIPAPGPLRRLVLDALELPDATNRLLLSPQGPVSFTPFALLDRERDIVMVPSGTTYALLAAESASAGARVLAVGDPRADDVLPATRVEAKALGDVVLLGAEATETRVLETAAAGPRWRAVHLACHGRVDARRPLLSALALAPGDGADGSLTTMEVFRAKIPADLVVLSACDTARGKVHAAEGVVGFTRAFMFAGARRVIASLWKVDDEATRALMVKFYELWKDRPAATALRLAQRHVAAQDKWSDPHYWAAWQLWGVG